MSAVIATALIRKLNIWRFRGLENFEWCPEPGMNVVLGGGDVGKSTVLEAVALLLSPSNATVVSESDYWQRDSTQEFVIEAVMALTTDTGISSLHNFSWPWTWNGKDAVVPSASEDDDMPPADDPVYRARVRGTTELDLVWEIVQPHTLPITAISFDTRSPVGASLIQSVRAVLRLMTRSTSTRSRNDWKLENA